MNDLRPKVGLGVIVFKGDKILFMKRKGLISAGEYALPGGHVEHLETFEECAKREVLEECGVEIHNVRFAYVANITEYAPKHYVQIGMVAEWKSGEPKNLEPEKAEEVGWYSIDNLPKPIAAMSAVALKMFETKSVYRDGVK